MATSNNIISPVPNNQPVINQKTLMITQVWSSFFNDMFNRIGGPNASTNLQLGNALAEINAISELTGDVVAGPNTGIGPATATISTNSVTNQKLAQMPANTIKGNNTASTADAKDLTVTDIVAMLPVPFSFFSGPISNTASGLVISPTFVNFSNSPTLTFTPTSNGVYKIYASVPLQVTNSADSAQVIVSATLGSPTLIVQSVGNLSGASNLQSNQYIQSVFTLISGTSYSFDIQGQCTSSAGCNIPAIQYCIFAERVA